MSPLEIMTTAKLSTLDKKYKDFLATCHSTVVHCVIHMPPYHALSNTSAEFVIINCFEGNLYASIKRASSTSEPTIQIRVYISAN